MALIDNQPKERFSRLHYFFFLIRRNPLMILGLLIILTFLIVTVTAPLLASHDPIKINPRVRLTAPNLKHLFGTDEMGRDIFSRIVYGTRITLQMGLTVIIAALLMGSFLGILAGFFGGFIDELVMRLTDIFMSFPYLVLAMVLTVIIGPSIQNAILAMAVVWWPTYARLIRSEVLRIKQMQYIKASRGFGASNPFIILRHIVPNSWVPVLVQCSLDFGRVIMYAASLSFIGLGPQPPSPEWGAMINAGRFYIENAWWYSTFPGLAIMITILGFNLLGDGLRDILDPRLRR
jgi:peptide/nickel transport system permease protein